MTTEWANTYAIHTWPLEDLIEHELHAGCVCAPLEEQRTISGDNWFIYVHSSLDQREKAKP